MKWTIDIQLAETTRLDRRVCEGQAVLIGRDAACDIVINEQQVSKRHAYIRLVDGKAVIEDLASTNGTFVFLVNRWLRVNGKIDTELPARVRLGQLIQLAILTEKGRIITGDTVQEISPGKDSKVFNINSLGRRESILIVDLCGSCAMANKNDAMAYHLKTRLEDIAVNVCLQNCATFHKSTGDGLLATFTDSVSAANAAKDILRDIDVRNSHTVNPVIDVRLSLHHGSTYKLNTGSQDLHGNDINIAFRIECLRTENFAVIEKEFPDRNRVLCSDDFVWEVRTKFPQCGLTFAYCGEAFLKGIRDTKSIFLLDASSPM